MPEAYTNNLENTENQNEHASSGLVPSRREIPKRRGSKYADILLQRLQTSVLEQHESAIVGLAGFLPRQGVTTMAANIAIRAADHHFRPTLLIDCNFENQKLTRLYRCTGNGFGECLNGNTSLDSCVKNTKFKDLRVLGVGQTKLAKQIVVDPETIGSMFKIVRQDYRFSVVDLPPVSEPSMVDCLLPELDGVLIVARYGTQKHKLSQMQNKVVDMGGKVLGIVMTGNEKTVPNWVPRFFR